MLSYPVWQRRFAGRSDVVGQTVQIDGQPTRIIGVMPEGFGLLDNSSDAWFAFGFEPPPGQEFQHNLRAIGRLKPGVSMAEAQAAVKVALDEYAQKYPNRDKGWTVELTPWREARFGGMRQPFRMVQLAVGVMLLLVCVSVAVLMRARTVLGERSAVLASTRLRPGVVLAESLLLALGGGAIGAALAAWGLPALRDITPTAIPRLSEVGFDAGVVAFTVVFVVLVTLAVGILPASTSLEDRHRDKGMARRDGARGARRRPGGAGIRDHRRDQSGDASGWRSARPRRRHQSCRGCLSVDVHLPREPYVTRNISGTGSAEIAEFSPAGAALYDRIRAALQTMPGVVQAAGVGTHPFAANPFVQFWIGDVEHTPDNQVAAQYLAVTENYFNTMGIRIVRGRDFSAADRPDSPWVVLVNETLAKQQWPGGDPIGQRLTLTFSPNDEEPAREVVGLVADTIPFRGASEVPPLIYVLHRQQATAAARLARRPAHGDVVHRSYAGRSAARSAMRSERRSARSTPRPRSRRFAPSSRISMPVRPRCCSMARRCSAFSRSSHWSRVPWASTPSPPTASPIVNRCSRSASSSWRRSPSERRRDGPAGCGSPASSRRFSRISEVTPSDPMPLVVTGGVILMTALVVFLVSADAGVRAPAIIIHAYFRVPRGPSCFVESQRICCWPRS